MNDNNKKLLIDNGALHPLIKLLKMGDDDERDICCHAIWNLSFDKTNKDVIFKDSDLMALIRQIAAHPGQSKKAAECIIFLYEEYKGNTSRKKKLSTSVLNHSTNSDSQHIMISYQWSSQDKVKKIANFLKENNFKIWVDIENMEGSTLQGMADGIEGSSIVLICYSRSYKESPSCRMGNLNIYFSINLYNFPLFHKTKRANTF